MTAILTMTAYWKHPAKGGQRQVTYRESNEKSKRLPVSVTGQLQRDSLPQSEFTGTVLGWIGVHLAVALLTLFSLGLAYPWLFCAAQKWIASHTRISGKYCALMGPVSVSSGRNGRGCCSACSPWDCLSFRFAHGMPYIPILPGTPRKNPTMTGKSFLLLCFWFSLNFWN